MKFNFNKKHISIGIISFIVICLSIMFCFLTFKIKDLTYAIGKFIDVIQPVIFGAIIAYLLTPVVNFFERNIMYSHTVKKYGFISVRKKKVFRVLSVILTYLLLIILIYGFIKSVVPELGKSISKIVNQLPLYLTYITEWGDKLLSNNDFLYTNIVGIIETYSETIYEYINGTLFPQAQIMVKNLSFGLYSAIIGVWNLIIGLIISIYILMTKEKFAGQFKKIIYCFFSTEKANLLIKDTRFVSDTFVGFFIGKIIDSIIIGILCFLGLTILKMPYTILISVVIGITNIIPFFGPFIGAVPCAFLILMDSPLECLYFIIFVVILQQIDGNIIGPKILGDSTGISGFWVIFSITVFGGLWGVLGMFIGIPLFAVLYAIIKRNIDRRLQSKNLPIETDVYMPLKSMDTEGNIVLLAEADDNYFLTINQRKEDDKLKEKFKKIKQFINKKKNAQ